MSEKLKTPAPSDDTNANKEDVIEQLSSTIRESIKPHIADGKTAEISRYLAGCIAYLGALASAKEITDETFVKFVHQFYECDTGCVYMEYKEVFRNDNVINYIRNLYSVDVAQVKDWSILSADQVESVLCPELIGAIFYGIVLVQNKVISEELCLNSIADIFIRTTKYLINAECLNLAINSESVKKYHESIIHNISAQEERKKKFALGDNSDIEKILDRINQGMRVDNDLAKVATDLETEELTEEKAEEMAAELESEEKAEKMAAELESEESAEELSAELESEGSGTK